MAVAGKSDPLSLTETDLTAPPLPRWALELAHQAVLLHERENHAIILARFDGKDFRLYIGRATALITVSA